MFTNYAFLLFMALKKAGMAGAGDDLRGPFCEQASLIAVFQVADCTKKDIE